MKPNQAFRSASGYPSLTAHVPAWAPEMVSNRPATVPCVGNEIVVPTSSPPMRAVPRPTTSVPPPLTAEIETTDGPSAVMVADTAPGVTVADASVVVHHCVPDGPMVLSPWVGNTWTYAARLADVDTGADGVDTGADADVPLDEEQAARHAAASTVNIVSAAEAFT
jgi:hypothetical protein